MDVGVWMDDGMGKISVRWGICPFFFLPFFRGAFFFLSFPEPFGYRKPFWSWSFGEMLREGIPREYIQ